MSHVLFALVDAVYANRIAYARKWDLPSEAALQDVYRGWWRSTWAGGEP